MLVADLGGCWQLVEQTDHAAISGELASAWGQGAFAASQQALVHAASRHDDGWAVWDRHPLLSSAGAPLSFLEAPVDALLRSYQACVDAVCYDDPHAGLLVSMHVSGLRRGRYNRAPGAISRTPRQEPTGEDPRVTQFVEEEEQRQASLSATLGIDEQVRWHEYALLQLFDVLSLELCLRDFEGDGALRLAGTPTSPGQETCELVLAPDGEGGFMLDPWPFARRPLELRLRRRLLVKQRFAHVNELRQVFYEAPPESTMVVLTSDY